MKSLQGRTSVNIPTKYVFLGVGALAALMFVLTVRMFYISLGGGGAGGGGDALRGNDMSSIGATPSSFARMTPGDEKKQTATDQAVLARIPGAMKSLPTWMRHKPFIPPELRSGRGHLNSSFPQAHAVIVSGASDNHILTALCMIESIRAIHHGFHAFPIIFYDLGLSPESKELLQSQDVLVRTFDYSKYPPHYNINVDAGQYAWKPAIILELARYTNAPIIWMDAGDRLLQPLFKVITATKYQGVFTRTSVGVGERWIHPGMVKFMQFAPKLGVFRQNGPPLNDKFVMRSKNLLAGILAVNPADEYVFQNIIVPWAACAWMRDCVAPKGSSRANHRQDQAALTVLIHWKYPKYINHAEGSNFKLSAGCWVRHQDEKRWPKCMIDKLKVPKWAPTLGGDNAEAEEEEAAPVPKHTKKKKKKHHK